MDAVVSHGEPILQLLARMYEALQRRRDALLSLQKQDKKGSKGVSTLRNQRKDKTTKGELLSNCNIAAATLNTSSDLNLGLNLLDGVAGLHL